MARESTLDEFGDGGADGDQADPRSPDAADRNGPDADDGCDDGGAATGGAADGAGPADEDRAAGTATDAAPATVTYEWRSGVVCEACGATVERRWRAGDDRVCADCKEW
ncbi:MAG: hypothetical protein ABEJ81_08905 [Haloferacaceae archaeon]